MITTVTGKNQITIPAELARELDIAPGTKLDWTKGEAGAAVCANRVRRPFALFEGH
jgi:AbrB family looped-hinge helix DNA binding protein